MSMDAGEIIIVGAGNYAKEVYSWALDCGRAGTLGRVKGFLDDRAHALDGFDCAAGIIGTVETYEPKPSDRFICAIGESAVRKKYAELLKAKGAKFASLIHPTAIVGQSVRMGEGAILAPYSVLTAALEIGCFVNIGLYSACSHHNRIGDWCQISGHCSLPGRVVLEEGVFLACGVVLVPGVRIGAWSFIGAGSVVLKRVPPRTKMFGVPAVPIGSADDAAP